MTEEMTKLRQMLKQRGIEFIDRSDPEGSPLHIDRTHFIVETPKTYFFSVIHRCGTFGGWNSHNSDKGLLEVQVNHRDPEGFKTAEDVMKMVEDLQNEKEI